jgi:hypothetical protein
MLLFKSTSARWQFPVTAKVVPLFKYASQYSLFNTSEESKSFMAPS